MEWIIHHLKTATVSRNIRGAASPVPSEQKSPYFTSTSRFPLILFSVDTLPFESRCSCCPGRRPREICVGLSSAETTATRSSRVLVALKSHPSNSEHVDYEFEQSLILDVTSKNQPRRLELILVQLRTRTQRGLHQEPLSLGGNPLRMSSLPRSQETLLNQSHKDRGANSHMSKNWKLSFRHLLRRMRSPHPPSKVSHMRQ
jgi:hypothetical protein